MTGALSPAPVVVLDEIDSTNAEARRRAEAGETGPVWIVGLRQTAGRGRRGRAWETGDGNLAATLLFATDKPPAEAAQVSFVAALAVADLLGAYVPAGRRQPQMAQRPAAGRAARSAASWWSPAAAGRRPVDRGRHRGEPGPQADRQRTARHRLRPPGATPRRRRPWRRSRSCRPPSRAGRTSGCAWASPPLPTPGPPAPTAWARPASPAWRTETLEGIAEGLDGDGALRLRLADGQLRRITAGDVFFGGAS